jgi:hypothetical protein
MHELGYWAVREGHWPGCGHNGYVLRLRRLSEVRMPGADCRVAGELHLIDRCEDFDARCFCSIAIQEDGLGKVELHSDSLLLLVVA